MPVVRSRLAAIVNTALEESLLLPAGALIGLIWANLSHVSYARVAEALHFAVNDIGMAFFFALAMKEVIEATVPGGPLGSARQAALPVFGAAGGMIGPAALYVLLALGFGLPELARGWAIPCATDIAFSYLAARFVFRGEHPGIPFLLLLAIADDVLGIILLALFYPTGELRLGELAVLTTAAIGATLVLRRVRVVSLWPYLLTGVLSWAGLYRGGLHPALALVAIVALLPHGARDPGLFVAAPPGATDTLSRLELHFKRPVAVILFAFGLVNAGVPLVNSGPGTWIVLLAVLAGKPLGIVLFTLGGSRFGLEVPAGLTWRDLIVVGCAAGIGFTVALFFATAAFPPGPLLDQAKLGALYTVSGAMLAVLAAAVLRVGRFAR